MNKLLAYFLLGIALTQPALSQTIGSPGGGGGGGGGSGTVTSVGGGCGSVASPSPVTTSGNIFAVDIPSVRTSGNFTTADCGETVYYNSASDQSPTLPTAASGGNGAFFNICNIQAAQTITASGADNIGLTGAVTTQALGIGTATAPVCINFKSDGVSRWGVMPFGSGFSGNIGVATGTSLALGGCTISTNALCTTGTVQFSGNIGIGVAPSASYTLQTNGDMIFYNGNGAGTITYVKASQNLVAQGGSLEWYAGGAIGWSGRAQLYSSADGLLTVWNNGTTRGSIIFGGSNVPVLTGCGTSPSIDAGATNFSGEVTEGTTATGCVITFATAFANKPYCTVTTQSTLVSFTYTTSASAITVTNTSASGDILDYVCVGH